MKNQKKKPDNVVWDEEKEKYYAHLLPYPSNVGAPVFFKDDTSIFEFKGRNDLKKVFEDRYKDIYDQYNSLVEDVKLNNLVYSSKYNFIPVVGHVYYLYINRNEEYILSLISPDEWNNNKLNFLHKVKLNNKSQWELIKDI
jgi:hypothetical protein